MNKLRRCESEQGFTLLELLIVVLIIGVLTGVAVPVYMNQRNEAIKATLKSDLKKAALAIDTWAVSQGTKKTPITIDNVELFRQVRLSDKDATIYVIGYSHRYHLQVVHPKTGYYAWYRSDKGGITQSNPEGWSFYQSQGEVPVRQLSIRRINDTTWRVMDEWNYTSATFS